MICYDFPCSELLATTPVRLFHCRIQFGIQNVEVVDIFHNRECKLNKVIKKVTRQWTAETCHSINCKHLVVQNLQSIFGRPKLNPSPQSCLHRKKQPRWEQSFHAAFYDAYFWHNLHLKLLLHKSCSAIGAIFNECSHGNPMVTLSMALASHTTYLSRDQQSPRNTPNFYTIACSKHSQIHQHAFSAQLCNIKVFSLLVLLLHDSMSHFLLVNVSVSVNNPSWLGEFFCLSRSERKDDP